MKSSLYGYGLMLLGSLILTVQFGVTKHIFNTYQDFSALQIAFWGSFGATIGVLPFYLRSKKSRHQLITEIQDRSQLLLIVSFLTAIGAFLWYYAMSQTSPSLVSFITRSDLIFVFLLGVIFIGEKIRLAEIISLIVASIGFYVLSDLSGEITPIIVFLLLLRGFLYAIQSFYVKKHLQIKSKSKLDSTAFTFWRALSYTVIMGIAAVITGQVNILPWSALLPLSGAQIIGIFIYRILYFEAHHYLPISKLHFLCLSTPVFVLISGVIFGQETLSFKKIIGGLILISGLGFFLLQQMNQKNPQTLLQK